MQKKKMLNFNADKKSAIVFIYKKKLKFVESVNLRAQ